MFVLTQVLGQITASGILIKVVDLSLVSLQMQPTNVLGFAQLGHTSLQTLAIHLGEFQCMFDLVRMISNVLILISINIVYRIPQNWKLRSGQWVSEDYQDISIYDLI